MAKKVVASFQTGGSKSFTKVIRMKKKDNGSYSFVENIVPNEELNNFLKNNTTK